MGDFWDWGTLGSFLGTLKSLSGYSGWGHCGILGNHFGGTFGGVLATLRVSWGSLCDTLGFL